MDAASLNAFLDAFLGLTDQGFGLIQADVNFVLNALIVIAIVLAGIKWALGHDNPVAPMFRKVLFVGFFAFVVNNWQALVGAIHLSTARLGLEAGGGLLALEDLHNPARIAQIGVVLFGRTTALADGMNIFTDAIAMAAIFLAGVLAMIGFFVLALQLFIALIAFKLGALAAFIALPWGVFQGTAWVAERPLGWVAGSAMRLFVLAFIASISMSFVETLPAALQLEDGGALYIALFGLTVLTLAWFGPQLAAEIVQGQPSLAAQDAVRATQGAIITGAGAGYLINKTSQSLINGARALGGAVRETRPRTRPIPPRPNYAAMRPRPFKGALS